MVVEVPVRGLVEEQFERLVGRFFCRVGPEALSWVEDGGYPSFLYEVFEGWDLVVVGVEEEFFRVFLERYLFHGYVVCEVGRRDASDVGEAVALVVFDVFRWLLVLW